MRSLADSLRKEVIWCSTLSLPSAGALDVIQLRFPRLSLHETVLPSTRLFVYPCARRAVSSIRPVAFFFNFLRRSSVARIERLGPSYFQRQYNELRNESNRTCHMPFGLAALRRLEWGFGEGWV